MHHLPPDYLPAHIIKGKSGTSRYSKCFFSSTKDEKISVVKNPLVLFDPDHKTSNFGTTNHIFTKVRLSTLLIETCFRSKPHPGFFAVFVVGNCCMNCVDSTGWVSFCTWTWLMISPTQSACIAAFPGRLLVPKPSLRTGICLKKITCRSLPRHKGQRRLA